MMQFPFQSKEITPVPPKGEMCEDCAYRPEAPERDPNYKGISLSQIDELAHISLDMGFPPKPFLCHAGCPPDGKGSYIQPSDPRKLRVCQGWMTRYGYREPKPQGENNAP